MNYIDYIALAGVVLLIPFTVFLIKIYARPDIGWLYLIWIFLSWYLGLAGVVLFPFDLANAELDEASPDFMNTMWRFIYFTTFVISWVILPIVQEYSASGSFSYKKRFIDSLKANFKFWIVMCCAGLIVIIWRMIVEKGSVDHVVGWLLAIANTYGLTLIVVLLGFGLAEAPRVIYRDCDPDSIVTTQQFRASDLHDEIFENKTLSSNIRERLEEYQKILQHVGGYEKIRKEFEIVMSKCPEKKNDYMGHKIQIQVNELPRYTVEQVKAWNDERRLDELASLHAKLNNTIIQHHRLKGEWKDLLKALESAEKLIGDNEYPLYSSNGYINIIQASAGSFTRPIIIMKIWSFRFLSLLCWIITFVVLFCEVTSPVHYYYNNVILSPFGLLLKSASSGYSNFFISFAILTYLSWACYLSLFKLKIPFFTFYNLHHPQRSDMYALCFNAIYLCRLQFSLIYHLFTLLQIDKYQNTSFYVFMGQMTFVPFLGKSFSFWLPIICVIVFIVTFFDAVKKLLAYIGFDPYNTPQPGNEDHVMKIREGKTFIHEYRRNYAKVKKADEDAARERKYSTSLLM